MKPLKVKVQNRIKNTIVIKDFKWKQVTNSVCRGWRVSTKIHIYPEPQKVIFLEIVFADAISSEEVRLGWAPNPTDRRPSGGGESGHTHKEEGHVTTEAEDRVKQLRA